jgi:cbb3-type cytochrome oxidase subunit 1
MPNGRNTKTTWIGPAFIRLAVVYFAAGVILGLVIGLREDFVIAPVHAHINLIGWASMALFGLLYSRFPAVAGHWLARWHFWLYNIGAPVFIVALYFVQRGRAAATPILGVASLLIILGVILFAVNIFLNVGKQPAAATGTETMSMPISGAD